MEQNRDGDMLAAKGDCKAPPTRDLNKRWCGRQTVDDWVGVGNFF